MGTSLRYEKWLLELTQLPTAAGCEQHVTDWVRSWARRRKGVTLNADRFGNLLLERRGSRSKRPIIFTAHMDHPAFVVTEQMEDRRVRAEFRGGVFDAYFVGSKVRLHPREGLASVGVIKKLEPARSDRGDRSVVVVFRSRVNAAPGDIMTWHIGSARIQGDQLRAPACDDLAGVAAALAAFDVLGPSSRRLGLDVRVLLTRAEEIGFVGAIAMCKTQFVPRASRLITLEMSKSFPRHSPIGGGPIVRVGDRMSSFDPDLTYRICRIAERIEQNDDAFTWQRKLMPGGTCEASAYQAYGYAATCLCLALGNYHNMTGSSRGGRIARETISLDDYYGLIRLLAAVGKTLDDPHQSPSLRQRLEGIYAERRHVLASSEGREM